MYEEDRTRALEMYDEIFEEVNNETAVLQLLVSPTRQAVNLARAYDARDRRYHDDGQEPAYQLVIEDIRRQAAMLAPPAEKLEEGQLSLFNDAEANDSVFDGLGFDALPETQEERAPVRRAAQPLGQFPDEDREGEPVPPAPPPMPVIEQPAQEAPAQEVDDFSDAVDAFLKDFAISDELGEAKEPEQLPVSAIPDEDTQWENVPQRVPEKKDEPFVLPEQESAPAKAQADEKPLNAPAQEARPARTQAPRQEPGPQPGLPDMAGPVNKRTNVPLLILFILLAVPVGLVCIGAILAFAGIFLSLAVLALYVGINGLIAAFGFSVFADILLVFGLSLALAAIGLLLLWLFIWLLIGAIPGFVRGVCGLGSKLCCKEVSA